MHVYSDIVTLLLEHSYWRVHNAFMLEACIDHSS